jgi:hypothetical protein
MLMPFKMPLIDKILYLFKVSQQQELSQNTLQMGIKKWLQIG